MPATPLTRLFANLAFYSALAFILLLALLHFIEPEFESSWHFISEYQLGKFGWMMCLAFFALGLSCVALCFALWQQANVLGKIGLLMLLVAAAGMILAAVNITDPLNTPEAQWTNHGKLHQQGATLDGIPVAAILIIIGLIRKNPYWQGHKASLIGATVLVSLGIATFIIAMAKYFPADRHFGPNVPLGWANRIMITTQAVWLAVIARLATKFNNHKPV